MKIAISCDEDPGDPGTTAGGIQERDMNIRVANALVAALNRCGVQNWFDPSITYVNRVAYANREGYDVLFACAHNAAGSPAAEGAQFIFCGAEGHTYGKQQLAAENVGNELVAAGIVARWSTYDEQVYECCAFNNDSVYCEFLFQTNPADLATERQPDYPVKAAEAACRGLASTYGFAYVPVKPPAPPPPPPPPPVPEWVKNQKPATQHFHLYHDVPIVSLVDGVGLAGTVHAPSDIDFVAETSVKGIDYWIAPYGLTHAHGVPKNAVTAAIIPPPDPGPAPAPTEYEISASDGFHVAHLSNEADAERVAVAYHNLHLVQVGIKDQTGKSVFDTTGSNG